MASASNTARSSRKKNPSRSYVSPFFSSMSPFSKLSTPKPISNASVNPDLNRLLNQKLVHLVRKGRAHDTLDFHRRRLLEDLKQRLEPRAEFLQDFSYRDRLITLLASTSKEPIKHIPLDMMEWLKLLNYWIRYHMREDIIFDREIHEILAVDGFQGFQPKNLQFYLTGLLRPSRYEFEMHIHGVRAIYRLIRENPLVSSLPGTDSACLVFLTLLEFYMGQLHTIQLNSHVFYQVQQAKYRAEGFLHKHSDCYRDVQNVDAALLESLAQGYAEQFRERETCILVGEELLKILNKGG